MQTLIAYAASSPVDGASLESAVRRVESYYQGLWPQERVHHHHDSQAGGLHLWDAVDSSCRWPSWAEGAGLLVGSLYVPLGYHAVVGTADVDVAPVLLARRLGARPGVVLDLGPPFVLAAADTAAGTFSLFTDALGVARLFRVRTPGWTVWSNRTDAACLFAGVRGRVDPLGWRYQAGTGWFMGDTTPLESVTTVPPGSHITFGACPGPPVSTRLDRSSLLTAAATPDLDDVARALHDMAVSVGRLWQTPLSVSLTGGRDSRVVAAAFISAGVDVRLHTHDAVPGEVESAQHLLSLIPSPPPHTVRTSSAVPRADAPAPPVIDRVLNWHRYAEGFRSADYLTHAPPRSLTALDTAEIGGAAGELAHGHYYPPDVVALESRPVTERLPAYREYLLRRLLPATGVRPAVIDEVTAQVDRVLRDGWGVGLVGATVLDYFYADERLRRWSTAAERLGTVTPLAAPAFVRAAFSMSPQQRLDAALHRDLLRHLVPQWADVPFFKAGPRRGRPGREPFRLGSAADREELREIFRAGSRWASDFDHPVVQQAWSASLKGRTTTSDELLLWRVVWRDLFTDHVADLNRERSSPRNALPPPTVTTRPGTAADRVIRAAARTRAGRVAARTGPGQVLAAAIRRNANRWQQ